jgi:hypothetical protein
MLAVSLWVFDAQLGVSHVLYKLLHVVSCSTDLQVGGILLLNSTRIPSVLISQPSRAPLPMDL